jgi:hypothetical protein
MKMGDEHGYQTGEVEPRVDERGRRSASTVDDEDPLVDD